VEPSLTIAEAAARCGLPQSTLRYWERIGLIRPVERDPSSRHRRYSPTQAAQLETLANLRAVGLSIHDMRAYLRGASRGESAAGEQRALFQAHSDKLADQLADLQLRRAYLGLKVTYWTAREAGNQAAADAAAAELAPVIRQISARTTRPEKDP
jgi:DNA-binding transcriptional MerR regulator